MNRSPEAQLLTRYALTLVLGILAVVIGPRAFSKGLFVWVLVAAAAITTRIVYTTPQRFELRNETPLLRAVWYVFVVEVVLAAVAFTLTFDRHGSFAGAIATLAVLAVLEIVASRIEHAEYVRTGEVIEGIPGASADDFSAFTGEAGGPANRALQDALADLYARVPTVVRAYLVMSASADGSEQRVLAVRFAYPWLDEDAVRAALRVFQNLAPEGDTMIVTGLDDRSEARARAVASPFYERATTSRRDAGP